MQQSLALGFDAGSVALKIVLTDNLGNLLHHQYLRTHGKPLQTALAAFQQLLTQYPNASFDLIAATGSSGRLLASILAVPFVNEVICQAVAIRHLHPQARTLIEMGGQDSKIIFLPDPASNGKPMVDFAMNTNCAAGTGSFLDQQASRLGINIENEFGALALKSQNPPRVAGRCSVFAKSDMIHLQQQAAPVHDIVAGLCLGLARNLKSNLSRGMEFKTPIAFCGGVAANAGVVHALEQVFELPQGGLIVPECHAVSGALGAILVNLKERTRQGGDYARPKDGKLDLRPLEEHLQQVRSIGHRIQPLEEPSQAEPDGSLPGREMLEALVQQQGKPIDAWLGLDVGSISTKMAVIDKDNRVLAKTYLMTAGRPLEAVRKVLREIGAQVRGLVKIKGAATTGSGRYLTGDVIGADLVINEITAQATAAAAIDPAVDTIFEIGGQDSKYIALDGGVVVDFEMNHACAAGTGSFLEEQAERLGISIKQQFAQLALSSDGPIRLGERCTVFMESDLLNYQQQGAGTADLVAGLAYSIVSNYINRVVGHRKIGSRIFFQGGTAFNRAVVSAFERFTGRKITVPPHHEVTGAIGAAVLARRHQETSGRSESNFGGFDSAEVSYEIRSFECEHCSNACEINEVRIEGREALFYGSRCDRYNLAEAKDQQKQEVENLFAERMRLLYRYAHLKKGKERQGQGRGRMGIPLALSNYQLLPFWGTLLGELGFEVEVSGASTSKVIHQGVEAVLSTPCFPVKVAHGHVLELIERGVDYVWLPSVMTMKKDYHENKYNRLCPYVQAIPYQVSAAVETKGKNASLLKFQARFENGPKEMFKCLKPFAKDFGIAPRELKHAIDAAWRAQDGFEDACRAKGREVLASLDGSRRAVVIISRPYNGCDPGACLDLPNKLRKMNVLPIPMDFLDLREPGDSGDKVFHNMYWKYGQRILHAAEVIRHDPRLHAVYLSNFSCGPDSFIISYFKRLMAPKPSLVLEVDEHSADAGVVTRLEAFLESLNAAPPTTLTRRLPMYPVSAEDNSHRTLYIPWMGDGSHALAAAFRAFGQPAEVIPVADQKTIELGRRMCTGKECLPCIITAGDMIKMSQRPDFDPKRTAFFMPGSNGPCRFGQYSSMHKLILQELGLSEVPIVAPNQDKEFYDDFKQFTGNPTRLGWCGVCATEILNKVRLALRPYELETGQVDSVYGAWQAQLCQLVEKQPEDEQVVALLKLAAEAFSAIPVDRTRRKPLIGIVGEMYVRQHSVANNDLVRQLERLGAEVSLASFTEWIYYLNWVRLYDAKRDREWRQWLGNTLENFVQRRIEQKFCAPFKKLVGDVTEPRMDEILKLAEPYVDPSFEGEAVLSVGKLIEFHLHGCHGVVNVMPFGCMPSTVVGGLMKKLTGALGNMPTLSLSYDGQQDPTMHTRLEAFIYQARAYQTKMASDHNRSTVAAAH